MGVSQSFTLAGLYAPGAVSLTPDNGSGVELALGASDVAGTEEVTAGELGAYFTVQNGGILQVDAGGTVAQDIILTGGTAYISGIASNDVISGNETIATGATVSGETVTGGTLELSGAANVTNLTLATGTLQLDNNVTLGSSIAVESEAAILVENGASLAAIISGFSSGDSIDITAMTNGTLTSSTAGGNTIETVTSGSVSESFTFAGTSYGAGHFTLSQGAGGETLATVPPTSAVVSAGQTSTGFTVTSGFTLDVLTGGTAIAAIVLNGGTASVQGNDSGAVISNGGTLILSSGGVETNATILAGGTETLIGPNSATGDQVYGVQQILNANAATGAILNDETIFNGGTVALLYKSNTLENSTILTGGDFVISGNATGTNITLAGGTITLESPKANLLGTLDFTAGTLVETTVIDATYGELATIEGFGAGDVMALAAIGAGATLSSSTNVAGDSIETVTSGSVSESFTFGGTSEFALESLSTGGVALISNASVVGSGSHAGGNVGNGSEIVVQSGATITGAMVQSGGTLVVNGGTESGDTILGGTEIISSGGSAFNTTITNGGAQTVTNGGTVTGATVQDNSTQILTSGAVAINITVGDPSAQIVSAGATASNTTLTAGGEQDVYGSVTSTTMDNGGTEVLYTGGTASESLINAGGTLVLDGGTATDTTLAQGGTILVDTLTYSSGMIGTVTGGDLVVSNNGSVAFSLQLDGDYTGDNVTVSSVSSGIELTLCFYPGTRIATPQGDKLVEALQPGDMVLTTNGAKPVRWLGQSHVSTRFADPLRSLPVRIAQGALGDGLPVRDLLLSPDHALFMDGILVQAGALVNGVTIIREADVPEQFTYYHVELATHELLLAEGVQAESFVDNVDRMHFHNWDERSAPVQPITEMPYPRAKAQRQLPPALRKMFAVAKRA